PIWENVRSRSGQEAALGLWKLYWRSLWAYRGAKSEWKAAGKRAFGDGPLGGFGSCIAGGLDGILALPRALILASGCRSGACHEESASGLRQSQRRQSYSYWHHPRPS